MRTNATDEQDSTEPTNRRRNGPLELSAETVARNAGVEIEAARSVLELLARSGHLDCWYTRRIDPVDS